MSDSKAGTGPIVIINPNSSVKVTEEIARSVAPFRCMDGPEFECIGITHGPATISTMQDSAEAALNVAAIVQSRPDASAFVVACFSDSVPHTQHNRTGTKYFLLMNLCINCNSLR